MNAESPPFERTKKAIGVSPLQAAWNLWAKSLPSPLRSTLLVQTGHSEVTEIKFKLPHSKYDNLVVINRGTFSKGVLFTVVEDPRFADVRKCLWEAIARVFDVEHIGIGGPIPLAIPEGKDRGYLGSNESIPVTSRLDNGSNILRSPVAFQPLHGDFGYDHRHSPYSQEHADCMFWAQATQYKIKQVWCPLHTMFSHGNINEKGRIMNFQPEELACTTVDLYAGIGYFAFCYRKRISNLILGWEINPWSIEGFRRGAQANGWSKELQIVREDEKFDSSGHFETFWNQNGYDRDSESPSLRQGLIMFAESNVKAKERIKNIRSKIPPVRHVNCGYLPTSEPSWETAVQVVDPNMGGFIHVHENISMDHVDTRVLEVEQSFQAIVDQYKDFSRLNRATCINTATVKTYAPGVMHYVMDIHISKDM